MCVWINGEANGEGSWAIFYHIFFCQKAAGAICGPVGRASVCTEMWDLMALNSVHI